MTTLVQRDRSHKHISHREEYSVRHDSLGNGKAESIKRSSLTESARDWKNIAKEFENAEPEKPEPLSK